MDATALILLILFLIGVGLALYYAVICFQVHPLREKVPRHSDMGPLLEQDMNGNHENSPSPQSVLLQQSLDCPDSTAAPKRKSNPVSPVPAQDDNLELPPRPIDLKITPGCASKDHPKEGCVMLPIDEEPSVLDGSKPLRQEPNPVPAPPMPLAQRFPPISPMHLFVGPDCFEEDGLRVPNPLQAQRPPQPEKGKNIGFVCPPDAVPQQCDSPRKTPQKQVHFITPPVIVPCFVNDTNNPPQFGQPPPIKTTPVQSSKCEPSPTSKSLPNPGLPVICEMKHKSDDDDVTPTPKRVKHNLEEKSILESVCVDNPGDDAKQPKENGNHPSSPSPVPTSLSTHPKTIDLPGSSPPADNRDEKSQDKGGIVNLIASPNSKNEKDGTQVISLPSTLSEPCAIRPVAAELQIVPPTTSQPFIVPIVSETSIVPLVASESSVVPIVASEPSAVPLVASEPSVVPLVASEPSVVALVVSEPSVVPLVAQEPSVVPHVAKEPSVVPLVAQEPSVVPLVASEPSVVPLVSSEPSAVPLYASESSAVPLVTSEPSAVPLVASEPSAVPLVASEPSAVPLVASEPSAVPLVASEPSACPLVASEPSAVPLVTSEPSAFPLVAAEPSFIPLVASEPSVVPLVSSEPPIHVTSKPAVASVTSEASTIPSLLSDLSEHVKSLSSKSPLRSYEIDPTKSTPPDTVDYRPPTHSEITEGELPDLPSPTPEYDVKIRSRSSLPDSGTESESDGEISTTTSSDPDVTEYSFHSDGPDVSTVLANEVSSYSHEDSVGLTNYSNLPASPAPPQKKSQPLNSDHPPTPTSDTTKSPSPMTCNDISLDEISPSHSPGNLIGTPPSTPPGDEGPPSYTIKTPIEEEPLSEPPAFIVIKGHKTSRQRHESTSSSSSDSSGSTSNGSYKLEGNFEERGPGYYPQSFPQRRKSPSDIPPRLK